MDSECRFDPTYDDRRSRCHSRVGACAPLNRPHPPSRRALCMCLCKPKAPSPMLTSTACIKAICRAVAATTAVHLADCLWHIWVPQGMLLIRRNTVSSRVGRMQGKRTAGSGALTGKLQSCTSLRSGPNNSVGVADSCDRSVDSSRWSALQ